jgi:hypothetical protein
MLQQNERKKKRVVVDESEKMLSSKCISHSMAQQGVDILLVYMGQRGFEYSGIKGTRKICTAMRRSLSSSQTTSNQTKYFGSSKVFFLFELLPFISLDTKKFSV